MNRMRTAAIAAVLLWPRPGAAQGNELTLDQALALARSRAPAVLAARARIDEARGRLRSASVLLRENPAIEAASGSRSSDRGDFSERELEIRQAFEPGGRRRARIESAQAGVDREIAASEDVTRLLLRDVAGAFVGALAAEERVRLATSAHEVARDIQQATERRYEAGDVPRLDVNLARAASSRARSEILAAQAGLSASLGELRNLLGMGAGEPLEVRGDLRDRRHYELDELLSRGRERPDLRMLAAEAREAEADLRLGRGMAWPDLGFRVAREREEDADVLLGGVTFTLPIFERGQGVRAAAAARAFRARLELDASRRAVDAGVRTAWEIHRRKVEAAEELETNALPGLEDNESLSRLGYEAGEISVAELLLIRRETLDTRLAYLDRLLEAALAGIELESRAGDLR